MVQYTLAPHWVEHTYFVKDEAHKITHSVDITDDTEGLGDYSLNNKAGTTTDWDTFVLGFGTQVAKLLNPFDGSYVGAWLYRHLPTDDEPIPLDQSAVSIEGTGSANESIMASQQSWTFYDSRRKIFRWTMINTPAEPFTVQTYADLGGFGQGIVDWFLASDTCVMTRAGRFLDGFGRVSTTYNDRLTQKYYGVR